MRRLLLSTCLLAMCVGASSCGFLEMVVDREPDFTPVGPRIEMGPIPTFDADGQDITEAGDELVWFETRDGYCIDRHDGGSCHHGGGAPEVDDQLSFGGTRDNEVLCLESVTSREVTRLEVIPGDLPSVDLAPLPADEPVPVAVFAACWADPTLDFDDLEVTGFTADGRRIASR